MQVMHAFQEWVQQYQTANKVLLESVRRPMGTVGGGAQTTAGCTAQLADDLPSGSLEAFARMQTMMSQEAAHV